jgi:hypothetical protein
VISAAVKATPANVELLILIMMIKSPEYAELIPHKFFLVSNNLRASKQCPCLILGKDLPGPDSKRKEV